MKFYLLHGKPKEKIRRIIGTHNFKNYVLEITNVPTKNREYGVGYITFRNNFPEELWKKTSLALEQYVLNYFYKKSKKERINWINFQRPTSALAPRSGISLGRNKSEIRVMFHFRVPTKGDRINGKLLNRVFETLIPKLVDDVQSTKDRYEELKAIKRSLEDQMEIKRYLLENNYLAFISDGMPLNGKRIKIRNPDTLRVPNAGRVSGLLIPEGKTKLTGFGTEILELLSKGYAYYKPNSGLSYIKSIRDLAWIRGGLEWLASYGDLVCTIGTDDLDYPNAIILENAREPNMLVSYTSEGILHKQLTLKRVERPRYNKIMMSRKIPEIKLGQNGLMLNDSRIELPNTFLSSIIERNQLRAIVDAISFSRRYINQSEDIKGVVSKTLTTINRKGLASIGLGFYTEFTRWQLFYLMYKLTNTDN